MKYTTITKDEFKTLKELRKKPHLIVNNCTKYYGLLQGFIGVSDFLENGQKNIVEDYIIVFDILKNHIPSLVSFSNFTESGEIRFQYYYDNSCSFVGVGYISLEELFNGECIKD